jgi:two-component system, chemotaxis family, protein-glutamate methylesterase/glutaminase
VDVDAAAGRDLVVIGGSAGAVEALGAAMAGLPADLPAAVLVVVHLPEQFGSALAAILDRSGPLPVTPAADAAPLRPGHVMVAVPDRHLLVRDGTVRLRRAPKQNRARPAVDALFRSAARWHGARTVGVVLSGSLDDGAAGLAAIDAVGGACVVQDPAEAAYAGMPRAALNVVPTATVSRARDLGAHLADLLAQPRPAPARLDATFEHELAVETDMAENTPIAPDRLPGAPTGISCPDCSGAMNGLRSGPGPRWICHAGHTWSPQSLLVAQREKVEQALWTAVSILEEEAAIHDDLARHADGAYLTLRHQQEAAAEIRRAAEVIRKHFPELVQ